MTSKPSANTNGPTAAVPAMTARIAHLMASLGIAGLPRNYELLFEALSGNATMSREIAALGKAPSQAALDAIALRHAIAGHNALAASQTAGEAVHLLADMSAAAATSRREKAIALQEIEEIAARMNNDPALALSDFSGDAGRLLTIVQDLLASDRDTAQRMGEILAQLEGLRSGLAASYEMLTHDPVTGLANDAALMVRLKSLFDDEADMTSALLVMRIDKLEEFLQSHAPGAGDETLKRLAAIFRQSTKKNDFVARSGKDQFCLVLSDVTRENATTIARRIAARVAEETFRFPGRDLPAGFFSLTIGISLSDAASSPVALCEQARKALAFALHAGSELRIYSAEVAAHEAQSYRHGAA